MSMHLTSGIARRVGTLATAGVVALSGAVVLAPTASADDYERTPAEVIEQIEAQDWPNYNLENPGPSPDIRFAQYFLAEVGYPIENPGEEFTEEMEALIIEFDSDHGLADDATLESETWIKIRNLNLPSEDAFFGPGDEGEAVEGIQYILNEKFDAGLEVNGVYDEATAEAVSEVQGECGIGEDGLFGRLTFKCVVTMPADGAAEEGTDEGETPAETPAEEGGDAEESAEETAGSRGYH